MSDFYDPAGEPITLEQWSELFELRFEDPGRESWWRKQTQISDDVEVSSVWLGLDHNFGLGGPPLTWETMIFGGDYEDACWRYPSRQQCFDDHERIVRALRQGVSPGVLR